MIPTGIPHSVFVLLQNPALGVVDLSQLPYSPSRAIVFSATGIFRREK